MYTNQIFKLTMVLDNERFHRIIKRVKVECLEENEYTDQSVVSKGIVVKYRNSQYKKKVEVIVNAKMVSNSGEIDTERFIQKLNKRLKEYFDFQYQIDDFSLGGVDLVTDIDVGDHENVLAYLKVLQRIGKVKGYSPSDYDCFDSRNSFCLDGNSNDIEFLLYDLESVIEDQLRNTGTDHKKLKSMAKESEGILRAEVRLAKPKAVKAYTNVADILKQIAVLLKNSQDIFQDVFMQIIPFGDFYKKDKATEIVRKEVEDAVLRRKMLRMLELVPEKKSLHLAQKAMSCRDIGKVMDMFAKINVSPITISKRHGIKYLKNLYAYFNDRIIAKMRVV